VPPKKPEPAGSQKKQGAPSGAQAKRSEGAAKDARGDHVPIEAQIDSLASLESLPGLVEALLFVSDDPISAERIAEIVDEQPKRVKKVLSQLASEYEQSDRGFQLKEVAGGYRLYSHPAYAPYIEKMVQMWDTRRLSQASLEALAIVAYKQPVTRLAVNAVRGVNSEGVISSLVEKHLIRPVGRDRSPGNPILYGTTKTFLERFGLRNLRDLPPLEEFAPDERVRRQIEEGLGISRPQDGEEFNVAEDAGAKSAADDEAQTAGFDARAFLEEGMNEDGG